MRIQDRRPLVHIAGVPRCSPTQARAERVASPSQVGYRARRTPAVPGSVIRECNEASLMSTGSRWLLVGTGGICRQSLAIDGLRWPPVEYSGSIYHVSLKFAKCQ